MRITSRYITDEDYSLLAGSLMLDEHHKDTPASFFYAEGTVCSVYEDEKGPICFVRGKPLIVDGVGIIQLDIQYLDNNDGKRNLKAMTVGFPELEQKAKEHGFTGFLFISTVPLLKAFCIKRLGFTDYGEGVLGKILVDTPKEDIV